MSDPSALSRRYSTLVVAAVSLIALTCVASMVPVPYVTERPGPVFDTLGKPFDDKPLLTFGDDAKTYPTDGSLDFTTVSVTSANDDVSLLGAISAWFEDDTAVVPKSLRYPEGTTAEESKKQSTAQLSDSEDTSRVAGLRAAGYTVPSRVRVVDVVKGGASVGRLEADDIVTTVNGTKVTTPDAAVKAVAGTAPGDTLKLGIRRDGKPSVVSVVTRPDARDASVPRIGVTLGTKFSYPVDIDYYVDGIGGPSAGTMFALAIYDKLTPGSLTGGRKIAGTGTISADGVVGPIGGIRQKMAGAGEAKATIFLVPAANCQEAADGDEHGLKLVKITKLDDAIASLEALAKSPQAKVPSCS